MDVVDLTPALRALEALGASRAALEADLASASAARKADLQAELARSDAEVDLAAQRVLVLLEDARDRGAWIDRPCPFPASQSPVVERFLSSVAGGIASVEAAVIASLRRRKDWPRLRLERIAAECAALGAARERLVPLRARVEGEKVGLARKVAALDARLKNTPFGPVRQRLAAEREALLRELAENDRYREREVESPIRQIEENLARLAAEAADLGGGRAST